MNRSQLLAFMRAQKWAVQASLGPDATPQAAVIGVAVTDTFELVFDTLGTTRKAVNLRRNPKIALVIGWDEAQTVQYEGIADETRDAELDSLRNVYLSRFPDGVERQHWLDIAYFRVRPTWMRYSDFRNSDPNVETWSGESLTQLLSPSST